MRKLCLLILSQFIGNLSEMNCETPDLLFQEENQGKPKTMEESSKNFLQKLVLGPDRFASEFFLAFKKHNSLVSNCSRDYKKMEMCPINVMKSV